MVCKDTRHRFYLFFLRHKNTTVAGDYAKVTVDDYGIDEAEFSDGRTELVYLLWGMGAGIVHIRHQFLNGSELHFTCCFHVLKAPIPQISQSRLKP